MRYFMHFGGESEFVADEEGRELPNDVIARNEAVAAARDLMAADVREGHLDLTCFIAVENEAHDLLFSVTFENALTMKVRA
ncbi:hypothetical protein ACFB49_06520 [Sphingomonas sp. DBB INV C78]